MHEWLQKWGKGVYKARWWLIVLWLVVTVLGGSVFGKLPTLLSGGGWEVPGSQSQIAGEQLAKAFPGRSASSLTLVVRDTGSTAGTPAYNDKLRQLVDRLKGEEGVAGVFSLLDASEAVGRGLIGEDPHVSVAFVDMALKDDFVVNHMPDYQKLVVDEGKELGVDAYLVGTSAFQGENSVQSQEALGRAEMIVFPLIIIILLLVFRSVVAMLTPLIVTIASLMAAMGIIYGVATQMELSVFVTNSAMMLGLGVGIDYSLFMVNRFKQELEKNDGHVAAAVMRTMETAGHTVMFSAITVIAALSALFVVPLASIKAIAFGGIAVVLVAGLASLTLLPGVLGVLGTRINKGALPFLSRPRSGERISGWKRWARAIMRRPVIFLGMTLAALLLLATPALNMKLYSPDMRMLPSDTPVRQGFALLEQSFGTGAVSPMAIVLHRENGDWSSPADLERLAALQQELARQAHVSNATGVVSFFPGMDDKTVAALLQSEQSALPADMRKMVDRYISRDRQTALIELKLDVYGSSDAAKETAKQLRDHVLPGFALPQGTSFSIGGETMMGIDTSKAIADSLLPALAIMLVLIFIILVVTFRSLLLPLKAIVLNLFSVAATYGILVAVFANGHGADLFGVEANGYIIHFVPVLLLALLFGLSTDYEVFLVSRVKEEHDRTGDNEGSIAEGIEKTGPLITGAAVLMFAVFTGFAFSGALPIQMLGFGMAVAIALDATVIRMLLVPVSMKLLGKWNWWMPGKPATAHRNTPAQPGERVRTGLSEG